MRAVTIAVIAIVLVGEFVTAALFALSGAHRAAPSPPSPPMSIAVIGDSYAAGVQNRVVWPTLLAQRTGWAVSNFALPGTGFFADGQGGQSFTYQVERAQGAKPRIIVIVGGIADAGLPDDSLITTGAVNALNKIKVAGQYALVVGPTWYEKPVPGGITLVSNAVRKAADAAGVPFLDALEPPWLTREQMGGDLSGPNDAGQSVIADKIAAWLRDEVSR